MKNAGGSCQCPDCVAKQDKKMAAVGGIGDDTYIYNGNMSKNTALNEKPLEILYTDEHMQLAVETVPIGGSVAREVHSTQTQFIRVEQGSGQVEFFYTNGTRFRVTTLAAGDPSRSDWAIVPANHWHKVQNNGRIPLKFSTIYSPPVHWET